MNQEEVKPGHKRVKILKFVGKHQPGDVVELPDAQAEALCKESSVHNGHEVVKFRKAIMLEESLEMESQPVDIRKLTQKELNEMGMKNIVPTPKDVDIPRILAKKKRDASEDLVTTPQDLLGASENSLVTNDDSDEGEEEGGEDEGSEAADEAGEEDQPAKEASGRSRRKSRRKNAEKQQ